MNINIKPILFFFLFGIVLCSEPLFPQQNDGGAFGAPVIKFTSIGGQNATLVGGRFGWVIDESIVLGGGFYGLTSKVKTNVIDPVSGQDVLLGFNCGGLELEYIFLSDSKIHASLDMFFAGGGLTYSVHDKSVAHTNYYSQDLLLWEPQANIEFEITDWFHLDAGVSYRIITSYDIMYGISKDDLKGISALLTFKFGRY
jgi:hypothetical protein